jgi:hypothetical protein
MIEIILMDEQMKLVLPDGTLDHLESRIASILDNDESSYELDTLKILASYVALQFHA